MKNRLLSLLLLLPLVPVYGQKANNYPLSPKDSVLDNYFGQWISDPYRWMENPSDPRLNEWLDAQKKITKKEGNQQKRVWKLREQIASLHRNILRQRSETYVTSKEKPTSKWVFDLRYNRLDRSPDLYYRHQLQEELRLLVKSKRLQQGKEDKINFTNRYVNESHNLLALEVSHRGSDWREVYFLIYLRESSYRIP